MPRLKLKPRPSNHRPKEQHRLGHSCLSLEASQPPILSAWGGALFALHHGSIPVHHHCHSCSICIAVRLGLPLIMKITDSGVLVDADTIPGFPTFPHEPSPRLPHRNPIATSPSHRSARLVFKPQGLAPTFKALCLVVPLSHASSLVLDSRPASIRSVLYHFAMIILLLTFMIRNTRVFPRDHLPFPFISL